MEAVASEPASAPAVSSPKLPKYKVTTLAEQGPLLPVGIADGAGGLSKAFGVRPWRMKEERELGNGRDKIRDGNMSQYVSMVLGTMLTTLGPHDFEKLKPEERRVHIAQMYMPDVFYAYVYLRVQALGPELALKVRCTDCGTRSDIFADLNSLEVKTVDKIEDATWDYKVQAPFTIRANQATRLTFGPLRWTTMESAPKDEATNVGAAKAMVIRGSIVGVNAERNITLADSELDDMGKRDVEKLTKLIDDNAVGPMMLVECECPKCHAQLKQPIDWSYDSFFGASSR